MAKAYKAVILDWSRLVDYDPIDDEYVCLSQRQIAILKALLITAYWKTRWTNLSITEDQLNAMMAEIDSRLDGSGCMLTFCERVAECIENSEDTGDALTEWSTINNGNGGIGNPEKVLPESERTKDLLPEDFTCDNDHRYGTAVGIVFAIHSATLEVLEKIEVLTNPLELAAEIADNLPLAEVAGIAAEVLLWVQDEAYELYVSAWSDIVKDQIACEIFCLMQDEWPCHLDYEMLMDVYLDDDFPNPPSILDSWLVWAEWLLGLPFTADVLIVKLVGLLGLLTMRYGGKFGEFLLGVRSLETTIHLLKDDTNPDWETLCTECPERWSHTWNFATHGMEAFIIAGGYGEYQVGVGVVATDREQDGWFTRWIEYLQLPEAVPRCDRHQIHVTVVRGNFAGLVFGYRLEQPPVDTEEWNSGHVLTGTTTMTAAFNLTNLEYVRSSAVCSFNEVAPNGSMIITGVTLQGVGSDPFEGRVTS